MSSVRGGWWARLQWWLALPEIRIALAMVAIIDLATLPKDGVVGGFLHFARPSMRCYSGPSPVVVERQGHMVVCERGEAGEDPVVAYPHYWQTWTERGLWAATSRERNLLPELSDFVGLTPTQRAECYQSFADYLQTWEGGVYAPEAAAIRAGETLAIEPLPKGHVHNALSIVMIAGIGISLSSLRPLEWFRRSPTERAFGELLRGRCPSCGYSIVGLPERKCPECGGEWG